MHDDDDRKGYGQQMILYTMALLVAEPIHKKAVLQVDRHHRHNHRNRNAHSRDAAEKSNNQSEAAKELGRDRQIGKRRGNSKLIAKCT